MKLEARYDRVRLQKLASMATGPKILDIGYAIQPNQFLPPESTTGLDLDFSECDYAEKVVGNVKDISKLLSGSKFNTIIAAEFIEHIEDPYSFLRSLHPHIDNGGQLLLSTPNPVAFPTLLLEWTRSHRFFYTENHKYYFPPRWLERVLDQSGFVPQAVKSVGLWPFAIPGWLPASLSYQVIYVATPRV